MNSLRRLTSLTIAFSFLIESYTGIFLFIAPRTRVATSIDWKLWGFSKAQYVDLHITFMIIFLLSSAVHIYLNWKPMVMYFKNKARAFSLTTKEFLLAFGINALFVIGTLYHVPPFQTFLDWGLGIRDGWGAATAITPIQPSVAPKESTSTQAQPSPVPSGTSGYGRLSLQEGASQAGLSIEKAIAFVQQKGFNATPKSNLKEIADALATTPLELIELLKNQPKENK